MPRAGGVPALHIGADWERAVIPFFVVVSSYRDITAQEAASGQPAGDARMAGPFASRAAAAEPAAELKAAHATEWPWTVVDVIEARDARTAGALGFARWLSHDERLEAIEEGRGETDR